MSMLDRSQMIAKPFRRVLMAAFMLAICNGIVAQPLEYRFTFPLSEVADINSLSRIISIDKIEDGVAWAYASPKEMNAFRQTGIAYELLPDKSASKVTYQMATTISEMQNWDRYPTYSVYDSIMRKFASDYPSICKLEVVGTLTSGRQLLSVKISSDVDSDNTAKPEMLCTGSMHGDEEVCMVTALHLCSYLLENYQKIEEVTNLIDKAEFWILPLFNPDGMYRGGDDDISGSTRGNAHSVDLNRNFPHVNGTELHPDGNEWQQETLAMMDFFKKHHFTLSANIHAGNECFNYPWDSWQRLTADNDWWRMVGSSYRDTTQYYSPSGYFDDGLSHNANGLTNGWSWYSVVGGQQDYANYYAHCREVTIEISSSKTASNSMLPNIWEYNRRSLLNYFSEGLNGVSGIVTDVWGNPLSAVVAIDGFDKDNSWVETDDRAGDYHRLLKAGTYQLTFSAEGYFSQTVEVVVADGQSLTKNIILEKKFANPQLAISPVVLNIYQKVETVGEDNIVLSNIGNCDNSFVLSADTSAHWLSVDKTSGNIPVGKKDTVNLTIDSHNLSCGDYSALLRFSSVSQTLVADVRLTVQPNDTNPAPIAEVASVSIAHYPSRLEYSMGDTLDLAGGLLNVTYDNDSTVAVAMRPDMVDSFDSSVAGTQIVLVKFGKYSVMFSVTINAGGGEQPVPMIMTSVSIVSLPSKLLYEYGDTLNLAGGVLKVNYDNGTSVMIPMTAEMLVGYSGQVEKSQNVIIGLGNCSTMFGITVVNGHPSADVKSVSLSALPLKLEYNIGSQLDLAGGMLKVTYQNDSVMYVAIDDTMVTGFDSDSPGSRMLAVSYSGFDFHFYVNVVGVDDAIDKSSVPELKVYACNGAVIVDNADSEILIFDIAGHLAFRNAGRCSHIEIALPKSEVYIVKVGDRAQRIVLQ